MSDDQFGGKDQIVVDILNHLHRFVPAERRVTEIHLTDAFTTAQLSDGSTGACMSYYHVDADILRNVESLVGSAIQNDAFRVLDQPWLRSTTLRLVADPSQSDLLVSSLLAALASALSARVIKAGGDNSFACTAELPLHLTASMEHALVVGFGGLLGVMAASPRIARLHVLDLFYEQERCRFEAKLDYFRHRFPSKIITCSSAMSRRGELRRFDLISISGSTLCNDSLSYFLDSARRDAFVILQGQSASVHPAQLFLRGIKLVLTTIKPPAINQLAAEDYRGSRGLRKMMECRLPSVFMLRRSDQVRDMTTPLGSVGELLLALPRNIPRYTGLR